MAKDKKIASGNIEIGGKVGPGSVVGSGQVSSRNIAGGNITETHHHYYAPVEQPQPDYEPPTLPAPYELPAPGPLPPGSYLAHSRNPYFTGRESELLTLAKMLLYQEEGEDILVPQTAVASGLGGIGKTQLAVEFAHRYGRYFAGGIFWLNCANVTNIPAEVAIIGGKGGMGLYQDTDNLTLEEQVRLVKQAWQEPIHRLLIFDNCDGDDSIAAEAVLAEWRPVTGGCRVMATSRQGRWAEPLEVVQVRLDVLSRPESATLLRRFALNLSDKDTDEIAAELGDLPLALHLAASYLKRYSQIVTGKEYLAQLRDKKLLEHPSLQGRGAELSPTDHELHVGRTFALSYERLNSENEIDKAALALLARAACFAPGEVLPITLLQATLAGDNKDMHGVLLVQDGLQRLESLGLLAYEMRNNCQLHRLLVVYVQDVMEMEIEAAQELVAEEVAIRASEINWDGYPAPLLVWQQHLTYVAKQAIKRDSEWAGRLLYELGHHMKMIGDYETAQSYYERALAIDEAKLGKEHPDVAHTYNNLGMLLLSTGEYEDAKLHLEQALAIRKKILGLEHVDTARSLNNLGFLLHEMRDYEGAKPYYEQTLEIRIKILGSVHIDTAISLNNLGKFLYDMGDYKEARLYYEQALAIKEQVLDPEHPQIANSLNNLGVFLQEVTKDYELSRSYLERSLAIYKKAYGENHPSVARALNNLGVLLHVMGDYSGATLMYKQALVIFKQVLSVSHPSTQTVHQNLSALENKTSNNIEEKGEEHG